MPAPHAVDQSQNPAVSFDSGRQFRRTGVRRRPEPEGHPCEPAESPRPPGPAARLSLQALENRLTPAVRTWTGLGADDLWSNAANWDTGVPADGDDVRIPATAESAEVLFDFSVPGEGVTLNNLTSDGTNAVGEPFRITNDTLTLSGPGPFAFGDALTMQGGIIAGSSDLTVSGLLTWNSGAMSGTGTTFADGGIALNAIFFPTLQGRRLDNNGTATWTGGSTFIFSGGGTFNNNGTFDAQTDSVMAANGGGSPVFNNAGTFRKSAGLGTTTVGLPFNNTGSVDLQSGTTTFNGFGLNPAVTGSGPWAVAGPAVLQFGGSTSTLSAGATVSGAGTVFVSQGTVILADAYTVAHTVLQGGTTTFNAPTSTTTLDLGVGNFGGSLGGSGDVTVSGLLTWSSGSMSGTGATFANGGLALNVAVTNGVSISGRRVDNNGTATWTGGGFVFSGGGTFNNNGTFDAQNDQAMGANSGGSPVFNNAGTFRKSAGAGTTDVQIPFANPGTIDVRTGTLNLNGELTNYSAGTKVLTGGTYDVAGTLMFRNADVVTNAATVVLDGPSAQILNTTGGNALANFAANAAGGSLTPARRAGPDDAGAVRERRGRDDLGGQHVHRRRDLHRRRPVPPRSTARSPRRRPTSRAGCSKGSGTVAGDLTNAAEVRVGGSPGVLTVTGGYTQAAAGSLDVEVGGPAAGSQFDQLVVNGPAALDGTVNVTRLGGFIPAGPDAFRIVDADSRAGAFATLTGSAFPGGQFVLLHDATAHSWTPTSRPPQRTTPTPRSRATPSRPMSSPTTPTRTGIRSRWSRSRFHPGRHPGPQRRRHDHLRPAGRVPWGPTPSPTRSATRVGNEATATITIAVTPVNHAPTLDPIPDPAAVPEDAGAQAIDLAGITAGSGDAQALTVTATSSNPGLIPNPTVTYTSPDATRLPPLHAGAEPKRHGRHHRHGPGRRRHGLRRGGRGHPHVHRDRRCGARCPGDRHRPSSRCSRPCRSGRRRPTRPGRPVADLLAGVTDADGDPLGLAVTAIDNRKGTWQFSRQRRGDVAPVPTRSRRPRPWC